MKDKIHNLLIHYSTTILSALQQMDKEKKKLLIVVDDENKFVSLLSIGDIQRAIIANIPIKNRILEILRKEIKVTYQTDDIASVKRKMRERRIEFMPIISTSNDIVDVLFWDDIFPETKPFKNELLNLPVVVMAGGKGERLAPLTNVLPKPLIPIGTKSIIEDIMDKFVEVGCHNFYISVNYKAETIMNYLNALNNSNYKLIYFREDKPLGTAGSLHLLKGKINDTFFVSNCDIIIDQDYSDIIKFHKENHNEITLVAVLKEYHIPYGTIQTKENGLLDSISEKPNFVYKINAGLYVLEPHLLKEIPLNQYYHITDLIMKLNKEGRKVGVFPVSEGAWVDIGNWREYLKMINIAFK